MANHNKDYKLFTINKRSWCFFYNLAFIITIPQSTNLLRLLLCHRYEVKAAHRRKAFLAESCLMEIHQYPVTQIPNSDMKKLD